MCNNNNREIVEIDDKKIKLFMKEFKISETIQNANKITKILYEILVDQFVSSTWTKYDFDE